MTILSKPLRRQLETTIKQAREITEEAAKEAIARMGVAEAEAPAHLSDDHKALRRRLRAHARTLGDTRDAAGTMSTARLQDAASYEIWHRMLFGRFLAERGLLIHPELGAAMSVAELRDLAKEEGVADEWALAERYAAPGLPGVFKPDDPVLALPIAPEFSKRLRALLSGLPEEVFIADDSLGWTYQFWRASEKDAVNAAGGKIGAAELPAVTQPFTESYMVKFLLHNTLGAWWAGKVLARNPDFARDAADEDGLREACGIPGVTWEYLRFVRDDEGNGLWRPAAGTFPGWPTRAAEITYCDPCCGSGHFLVEAFCILAALRQREEGLSPAGAATAVLNDNLHGLELDGRCVQIATFNVALAAWKLAGAPIALPSPLIAWVGAPPPMSRPEMAGLANGDASLRTALEALHDQLVQAPLLGSLLKIGPRDLLDADLRERGGAALEKLRDVEPEQAEGGIAARGLLDASSLLVQRYVLQATNVPFRASGTVEERLRFHLEQNFPLGKRNLATAMVERILCSAQDGGVIACVTPKEWLSARSFRDFRSHVLTQREPLLFAGLGPNAFESIGGEVVNVCLVVIGARASGTNPRIVLIDVPREQGAALKAMSIIELQPILLTRSDITKRRDLEISSLTSATRLLSDYVRHHQGLATGDLKRFSVLFWEIEGQHDRWVYWQGSITSSSMFSGRERVLLWEHGNGSLHTCEWQPKWLANLVLSTRNDLTLIVEDDLQPFRREGSAAAKTRDMKLHRLPWPKDELAALGEAHVELRATLSYFVEPNPGERGWTRRHRYASHGLRFRVKMATENVDEFRARINQAARDEEEGAPAGGAAEDWLLGTFRDRGSLHSDFWLGTGADLAERDAIGVFPIGGWWKEKPYLDRFDARARYALIVTIRAPGSNVDIFTPVETAVASTAIAIAT